MYLVKPYIHKEEININEHSRFNMPNEDYVSGDSRGLEITFLSWSGKGPMYIKRNYMRIRKYPCI